MSWSIGIFKGRDIFSLCNKPIAHISADQIYDVKAEFVADPFLFFKNNIYYMFFEVFLKSKKGCIGFAESVDGIKWVYKQIILEENFHMSYPYVFKAEGNIYMIPETHKKHEIRLYKAINFPYNWQYEKTLLYGDYADSTPLYYNNMWWLFTHDRLLNALTIFYTKDLFGTWTQHHHDCFYLNDTSKSRPAGMPYIYCDKIIRFVQNNTNGYGSDINATCVLKITPDVFIESIIDAKLPKVKETWCKQGRHHVSYAYCNNGIIAAIDGKSY